MNLRKYIVDINSGEVVRNIDRNLYEIAGGFSEGYAFVRNCNDEDRKYAYINKDFSLITEFNFDFARHFNEGYARVKINGKYGFINASGEQVIPAIFDFAFDFKDGLAKVEDFETGKWGYIDKNGKYVIPLHDKLGNFCDGLVWAWNKTGKNLTYYDREGNLILALDEKYKCFYDDSEKGVGLIVIFDENNLIDIKSLFRKNIFEQNKYVSLFEKSFKFSDKYFMFQRCEIGMGNFYDGVSVVLEMSKNGWKFGYMDKSGEIAIKPQFDFATRFCDGTALFSQGKHLYDFISGIVDINGNLKTIGNYYLFCCCKLPRKIFTIVQNQKDGVPNIRGKHGCVDKNGNIVVEPIFDYIGYHYHYHGYGEYRKDGSFLTGLLNSNYEIMTPPVYNWVNFDNNTNLIEVGLGDKREFLDSEGNIILPVKYKSIDGLSPNRFFVKTDKEAGIIDLNGNFIITTKKADIFWLYDNYALIMECEVDGEYSNNINNPYDICICDLGENEYYIYIIFPGDNDCFPNRYMVFGANRDLIFRANNPEPDSCFYSSEIMNQKGEIIIKDFLNTFGTSFINFGEISGFWSYIDKNGKTITYNCTDTCRDFIDGIAWFTTTHWGDDALYAYHENRKIPQNTPIADNVTSFFIDNQGNIIDVPIKKQHEYLQRLYIRKKNTDFFSR